MVWFYYEEMVLAEISSRTFYISEKNLLLNFGKLCSSKLNIRVCAFEV